MAATFKIPTVVTAEELFAMPDSEHYELVCGELKKSNMPTGDEHGSLTFALSLEIGNFVRGHKLGRCWAAETGFLITRDPDTVIAPDFAFVRTERLPEATVRSYVRAVPDLVLETRSPSDRPREVAEKVQGWLSAGVSMVLELNPAKQVLTVYRPGQEPQALGKDDTFDGAELLPGFSLPLAALFAEE
jgi:Uma2 family endonuclease